MFRKFWVRDLSNDFRIEYQESWFVGCINKLWLIKIPPAGWVLT